MENFEKKNSKKEDVVKEESQTAYNSKLAFEKNEHLAPVLEQLLDKALQEAENGEGIPYEEVLKRLKEKYPFVEVN